MKCPCGGETVVMETRTIDEMFRRKRKCNDCGEYFFTKEMFMYMAKDNPNAAMARPKIPATRDALSGVNRKKVEARRMLEDKREKKLKVPSYFIEEDY
jgi:transcriptional regulator NrdR family protein